MELFLALKSKLPPDQSPYVLVEHWMTSRLMEKPPLGAVKKSWKQWTEKNSIKRKAFLKFPLYMAQFRENQNLPSLSWSEWCKAFHHCGGDCDLFQVVFWQEEDRTVCSFFDVVMNIAYRVPLNPQEAMDLWYAMAPKLLAAQRKEQTTQGRLPLDVVLPKYFQQVENGGSYEKELLHIIEAYSRNMAINYPRDGAKVPAIAFLPLQKLLEQYPAEEEVWLNLIWESPLSTMDTERYVSLVKRWLQNKGAPSRVEAFQVCYYLQLSHKEAQEFFETVVGMDWIHPKNLVDVVFDMGLRFGLSIAEVETLILDYEKKLTHQSTSGLLESTPLIRGRYHQSMLQMTLQGGDFRRHIAGYLQDNLYIYSQSRKTIHETWASLWEPCNVAYLKVKNKKVTRESMAFAMQYLMRRQDFRADCQVTEYATSCKKLLARYWKAWQGQSLSISREDLIRLLLLTGTNSVADVNDVLDRCSFRELNPEVLFDEIVCRSLSQEHMAINVLTAIHRQLVEHNLAEEIAIELLLA